ncbi:MAG: hypothetical protein Fur0037_23290 [Planctomycetota bacterium]
MIPRASAVLCLLAAAAAQAPADTIRKKDGSSIRGVEVVSATLTSTHYKKGTNTLEVAAHQIADIEWGSVPEPFTSALLAMGRHDYEAAKQLFGEAIDKTGRAILKADARFLQCKSAVFAAAANAGGAQDAVAALTSWIGENADNWRIPEAMLLLGRARRLAGQAAEAAATLQELDDRAIREAWGPIWNARAKFELALTYLGQEKGGDARAAFQAAGSSAESALLQPSPAKAELEAIRVDSKVGEGETYFAEKDYARALSFFSSLTTERNPVLAAAGQAGVGQALYIQAAESKNAADLRKAQIALATACVLDSASGETSAKANYFLGKTLLALGVEREGDSFKARANAYFRIVARHYPATRWAALAQAELAR